MLKLVRSLPLLALAVAMPALAQNAGSPPSNSEARAGDIVVTARSLADTAAALAACVARNCPPDQDVAATLAHAENQFIEGDYRDARGTMLASLRRNRQHSAQFPVEVSDLQRANGRVAAHLGERSAYQIAVLDMRDTLREFLPADDPRVLAAQIEVADSRARLGYPDEARDSFADIATRADRLGLARVAGFARIRQASFDIPRDRSRRVTSLVTAARAQLAHIAQNSAVVGADIALQAEVTLARIDREEGNMASTIALVQRFASGQGSRRPLLISSDPIRLPDEDTRSPDQPRDEDGGGGNVLAQLQTVNVNNRWIDVGFWINGDGRVSDFEVLRSDGDINWARSVATSVNSRVYTPIRSLDGLQSQGFYIVERYTLTADLRSAGDCTGSHIRCRSSRLRVERMDLTPDGGVRPTGAS